MHYWQTHCQVLFPQDLLCPLIGEGSKGTVIVSD